MSTPPAAERPATFREVLESREFCAVYGASFLSWFGDSAARAAVTALVYQQTSSVAISAATFGISYLPWLGIGSVLATLAERYPYRRVMIICDLVRMVLMALVAIPGLHTWGLMAMLLATAMLGPPFDTARSALLPQILGGDRYVVGLSLQNTTRQLTIILGYAGGATLSGYEARIALLFNAVTFGVSALLIAGGVRKRPAALHPSQRSSLLRETAEGFTVIFRSPLLRSIAIVTFLCVFFSVIPEGLAAGWAAHLTDQQNQRGWYQGVIMISGPIGYIIGGLAVSRLVAPSRRVKLIKPFAVLAPVFLIPAFFDPNVYVVAFLNGVVGFLVAGMLPAANGLFVQGLPNVYRARAFGVMQSGVQVFQGVAILSVGLLADRFLVPLVVGAWTAIGTVVMLLVVRAWPSEQLTQRLIEETKRVNADAEAETRGEPAAQGGAEQGGAEQGGAAPRVPSQPVSTDNGASAERPLPRR